MTARINSKEEKMLKKSTSLFFSKLRTLSFIIALVFITPLLAAGATVDQVLFVFPYGEVISESYLRSQIELSAGSQFSPDILAEDIKRLYDTGKIADIEAEVKESQDAGELIVRFDITPTRIINNIVITGNESVKSSRIRRELSLNTGDLANTAKLGEGQRAIRKMYEERGYYNTRVAIQKEALENGEVNLKIEIKENESYKIKSVEFIGNELYSDWRLRRTISNSPTWWAHLFDTGFFNPQKLRLDKERLQQIYAEKGYLDFNVTDIEREYSDNNKWISLTFHLHEGTQFKVKKVEVTGNQKFSDQELLSDLRLNEGDIYNSSTLGEDLERIRAHYNARGFLDLRIAPKFREDDQTETVAISYQIEEGKPARIRDVIITGNTITQDRVLRREVTLQPGDLANSRKIDNTQSRLQNLNYFKTVKITPIATEKENLKDLEITVEEKMTGRWGVGGGLSSETGLYGFLEVQETNFDISKIFRFREWPPKGAGQRAKLRTNIGTDRNQFIVSFTEPWLFGRRLRFNTNLQMMTYDQTEYDEERLGGSINITRLVTLGTDSNGNQNWWLRNWRQSFGYRLEQIKLNNFTSEASPELVTEEGTYTGSAISFGMSRDSRDSFVLPTRGSTLGVNLELQSEAIGAYSNLYKIDIDGSKYFNLANSSWLHSVPAVRNSILKLKGEIGNIDRISGEDPAIFDRYFAGGQSTFRGFDYREVSPADINEDPLGGRSRLLGTAEIMYPLHDSVWISLFTDVGNVWRGSWDWDPADLNTSVGVGLQLDLQILPIRLDYGQPVITQQDHLDSGGTLHFSMGRSF